MKEGTEDCSALGLIPQSSLQYHFHKKQKMAEDSWENDNKELNLRSFFQLRFDEIIKWLASN